MSNRIAIQDGSASELGAQVLVNPDANPFSCSFHIKQELVKKMNIRHHIRRIS